MKKLIVSAFALSLLAASPLAACDAMDHAKGWEKDSKSYSKAAVKTDKKMAAKKSKSKVVAENQAKQKKI